METHSCPTRPDTTKWEELELCIFFLRKTLFFFTMLSSTLCVPLLHQSTLTSQTLNTSTRLKRLLHENDRLPALFMCYCLSSLFEALR